MTEPTSQNHHSLIIENAIARLRCCTSADLQHNWRYCNCELDVAQVAQLDWSQCLVAELNARKHIAWSAGQQVLWLCQKLVIPEHLHDYPLAGMRLRLALTWWAELAEIYVNGQLVQVGDLFDSSTRVLLSESVQPQTEMIVMLRLVSPAHDRGALVRSRLIYESTDDHTPEPGFIADELAVLQRYLTTVNPEKLSALVTAVGNIDWSALPKAQKFTRSLLQVRSSLRSLATDIKQRCIYLLSHAHLDLAWLWDISETWDAAERTFASVLQLQQEFPNLTFCHSTPALYAWIEQHRPDLFAAIQQQVKTGRWEVVGGLWVEPELNLVNGESIVRQLLYGQRYVLAKFGKISTVAWLPDSFGFCATLPQFLAQGGIEYFVTQKLLWNDTTKFPHGVFWWRSPDGTEIFSLMSAPIGEGIDPVKMTAYACDWETQTSLPEFLWLPGVGDRGGGPSRDMLEVAQRWQKSPFFPQLEFTTAERYLQQIREQETGNREQKLLTACGGFANYQLPTWQDELYLEFHRGCYTTHADQKRWNRRCEGLLYQAELFASLATISADVAYPKQALETAWKQVLFNQFHDILPGSSISTVYAEVNSHWQEVAQVAQKLIQQSLSAIASQITLPTPPSPAALPLFVFNSLNWTRSQVVSVTLPTTETSWAIYDTQTKLPTQLVNPATLLFLATDIPAVGYRLFWLCPQPDDSVFQKGNTSPDSTESIPREGSCFDDKINFSAKDWVLENEFLRVIVEPKNGNLSSIYDKIHQREILSGEGNQLQAFKDSGQYWDAWNIDPNYAQHPLPPAILKSIQWLEQGAIQTRLRVVLQLGTSEFCQDYVLQAGSPILKIVTSVNWQERQVLVKAAFPLELAADYATYEIPCGAIERPTNPKTSAEQAKWEVTAVRWADLGTPEYGVSLLNDCKYGYDSQPQQLRLTLLRSPNWPNPDADRGWHEFTYAIYPHRGTWQQAHTVHHGYELNVPLQVILGTATAVQSAKKLPVIGRLLDLQAENLILTAFKQAEDDPHQWIVRCYECHGETATIRLYSDLGLKLTHYVDLLEQPINKYLQLHPASAIASWKIVSAVATDS